MLKEREPEVKESYLKTYLRMMEKIAEEIAQKKREKERTKLEEEKKAYEEFKAGKGSNFPVEDTFSADGNAPINIDTNK